MEQIKDTRMPNACTFFIHGENHTLGNLLKETLRHDVQNVRFVGYKQPHPLDSKVELKMQTYEDRKPAHVLKSAIEGLRETNSHLRNQFQEQMKRFAS